jgi:hypothetical protein
MDIALYRAVERRAYAMLSRSLALYTATRQHPSVQHAEWKVIGRGVVAAAVSPTSLVFLRKRAKGLY